jgi:hypothetical protein
MVNNQAGSSQSFYLQHFDSTDDHYYDIRADTTNVYLTGVDSSERAHAYIENATNVTIYLQGYITSGAHFFTNAVDKSTATEDSYVDVDITADLQGADDASGAILEVFNTDNTERDTAVRNKAWTSYDYYYDTKHQCAVVAIDDNDVFQQKIFLDTHDVYLTGYTTCSGGSPPIARWEFSEGSGTNAADSAGTNDGTLAGPTNGLPAWTCVDGGYALDFDGDDDEVTLPGTIIGDSAAWTVSAWIKIGADTADQRTIYSEGDSAADEYWTLYVDDTTDKVKFWSLDGSITMTGTTSVQDNAWHLVTLVQRSKTDRELYVGTVSQATDTTNPGTLTYDTATIGMLNYQSGPADPFLGTIDDVRIYDRALSPAEIAALAESPPTACAAWMATGSYTGNGTSQSITSLGFQPEVVWIKADDANYSGAMSTSTMGSNKTKTLEGTGTLHSGSVTSLDSDGFSVGSGTDVNADTVTYYWTAFDANSDMAVNSYSGNGSATQAISGVGFSPDYVIILGDNGTRAYNRTTYGGLYARRMIISGASTDAIISLNADGFTAGDGSDDSGGNMNASSVDYHYIAFNEAAGKIDVNFYPGNNTDDTNITGVGFQPEFVIIQEHLSSADLYFKSDQMSGDSALNNRGVLVTNHIQALISDGFQVGDPNNVNETGKNYASALTRAIQPRNPAQRICCLIGLLWSPAQVPIR